jgi:hypothetical protein
MKDIEGFESRYAITEEGNIWSYPNKRNKFKGMWLKPYKAKSTNNRKKPRYTLNVSLFDKKGNRFIRQVHRIVAIAYIPNPDNKPIINHKDGNPLNPNINNLEWVTNKENSDHAFRIGLVKKPLTDGEIIEIRKIGKFYPYRKISIAYCMNPGAIWDICNYRRYGNVESKTH